MMQLMTWMLMDVNKYLCIYDPRNSSYDYDDNDINTFNINQCFCDNCFYGRTLLANKIIRLNKVIASIKSDDQTK